MPETICVNEMFCGLQGEGYDSGTPALFIRLQGCPIGCAHCDTPHAIDPNGGSEYSIKGLAATIDELAKGVDLIVFTGGEPLLQQKALNDMLYWLNNPAKICIETSGRALDNWLLRHQSRADLNLSPKTPTALAEQLSAFEDSGQWARLNQFKLVWYANELDYAEAALQQFIDGWSEALQNEYHETRLASRLFVQPLHITPAWGGHKRSLSADELRLLQSEHYREQIASIAAPYVTWLAAHPRWRLSLQLHKLLNVR